MTNAVVADTAVETSPGSYLAAGHTLLSWLTTTDHKRIAILYAVSITLFFFIGGIAIALVRLELMTPQGLFLTSDAYNRLFSLHGIIMVWFFLVPSIPATMGNFLLPLMIGARRRTGPIDGQRCSRHGRDEDCSPPPAQIPACTASTTGSSLGFWRRSGDIAAGVAS